MFTGCYLSVYLLDNVNLLIALYSSGCISEFILKCLRQLHLITASGNTGSRHISKEKNQKLALNQICRTYTTQYQLTQLYQYLTYLSQLSLNFKQYIFYFLISDQKNKLKKLPCEEVSKPCSSLTNSLLLFPNLENNR